MPAIAWQCVTPIAPAPITAMRKVYLRVWAPCAGSRGHAGGLDDRSRRAQRQRRARLRSEAPREGMVRDLDADDRVPRDRPGEAGEVDPSLSGHQPRLPRDLDQTGIARVVVRRSIAELARS